MLRHQDQLLEAKGHTKLSEAGLCIGITSKLAVGIVNCSAKYDILICTKTYLDGLITLYLCENQINYNQLPMATTTRVSKRLLNML